MKRFSYFASFCSLLILFLNDCFCKQEERVIRAGIFCKKEALEKIKTAANIDYAVFWGEGSVDLKYTFDEATGAVSVLAQDFIAFLEEVTRRFGNFPLSNFFVNGFLRTVFCGKLEGFCEDDYKNWVRIEKEKLEKYAVRFVKGFKDSGVFYIRSSTFILRDIGCRIFCNDKEVENRFFDEWKGGCVLREFCYKSALLRMFKFNEGCEMDEARGESFL